MLEYIVQLRDYNTLETQGQLVSTFISSAAFDYGLEIATRSPFAHQAPTNFVVLRMFYCDMETLPARSSNETSLDEHVCHASEEAMRNYVESNVTGLIKAVRRNKAYRKLNLTGLDTKQDIGQKMQSATRRQMMHESTKRLVGLRKETTLLVNELGVRELWNQGYKGQGVKIGIFDTGLSMSRLTNVKEKISWTHELKNTDTVGHGTFVAGVVSGTDAKCPGISPEAELFVFRMFTKERLSFTSWYLDAFNYALFKKVHVLNLSTGGPDFQELPFVNKLRKLTANGIILVSAVGNEGPHYGLLSNPADQAEVIGVGGITRSNEVAEFSSRGMTTWEFPFGSGRVKPDIVTLAEDISGSDVLGGCKMELLLNPASMKQILLASSNKLEARYESDYVIRNHIFEQGSGALNISKASKMIKDLWARHQAAQNKTQMGQEPLYYSALPLMVNLTILNPVSVVGTIKSPPQWCFLRGKKQAAAFEGIAHGTLRLQLEQASRVDDLLIPVSIKIIPTPPLSKRILWDQFHNIPYPSAFVPRDNLEIQHDLMDVSGDYPHTNFHQMCNLLAHGEEFFRDEIVALQNAVMYSNVSLIVFADWYDNRLVDLLELFDTSTLSKWHAITGGANIPAINELLQDFRIAFGDGVVHSSNVSLLNSGNDSSFPYWSGSYLTNFPVGGYLGYIDGIDTSARYLNGSERTVTDVPVLGLYEVPSHAGGRIAVFGDSSCLDSSAHPGAKFQNCFGMLRTVLRFTKEAVVSRYITLQNDSASSALQRLELEFVSDKSVLHPSVNLENDAIWQQRDHHRDFIKHSKVLEASNDESVHRSLCNVHAKVHLNSVELYVVLSNRSGRQNLGTYLRTASAFGATQVVVVGSKRFGTHGAHRAQKYVDVVQCYEFADARAFLKSKGCTIFGLSKQPTGSFAAHATPYQGTSAFVIDNEFPGLSTEQHAICDHFVHVPFHGKQTKASSELVLDTTVVTAITLHHFTAFAQFPIRAIEATSTQGKFVLDAYPAFNPTRNLRAKEKTAMREARIANAEDVLADDDGLGSIFE
ncbi:unnamed protein product [Peronospora belbahrii]|uniref:subtilisin n=1 Tax=Peronospora belbahrii TaxID=622444 RepID=A0AAU9L3B2_9STRA|nr:unnamed protein product [Peronospora belbahrii]